MSFERNAFFSPACLPMINSFSFPPTIKRGCFLHSPNTPLSIVPRDASVVKVVVGELEHALLPLGRAFLARAVLLAPRHCLKYSCAARLHTPNHHGSACPALLAQTLAAVIVDLQAIVTEDIQDRILHELCFCMA